MTITATAGNSRAPLAERGNDLYETPAEAVLALLAAEKLPHVIWEPACGRGAITRILRQAGKHVIATDLVDYHSPDQDTGGIDFLKALTGPPGVQAIVTNPPFKLGAAFVERGLALAPTVVMLLRLNFLESEGRSGILDSGQLARVHVFRKRLPMMHRDGWDGPKASSGMCFAWFVWKRSHHGPAMLNRISWEEKR